MPDEYEIVKSCQIPVDVLQGIYLDQFGYRDYGLFVEVGAWDGWEFSNTWGLARAGWHGLYIEACPDFAAVCKANHAEHSVEVEACAIGDGNGDCDLFLGGSVSSIVEHHAKAWGIHSDQCIRVPMRTLDFILEKRNWPNRYDMLVIDVEGAEESVLRGYSVHRWRPHVVIVETHEGDRSALYADVKGRNRTVEFCEGYFRTYRYKKVWNDSVNTIYVSKDMVA